MIDTFHLIPAQFQELLEEGERWIELEAGRLVRHAAPDEIHGNAVRNLAQAIAAYLREQPHLVACFDLGLEMGLRANTVRCPAISFFPLPQGFQESDKLITTTCPRLIMDIASSNDRRRMMSDRVQSFLDWGVMGVFVFDPVNRAAHIFQQNARPRVFAASETVQVSNLLPGFQFPVAAIFADPTWLSSS